ncbi:ABC transporter substrate-binding protein [Streptomyces sp. NBC_00075]|uniref:ABC transporter substrate-binding protein n=1 Tax=Streptomyces sp. NBC_00075 TaxID=2975641 RepID=UPI00324D0E14
MSRYPRVIGAIVVASTLALTGCSASLAEPGGDVTVNTVLPADPSGFSPLASRIQVDTQIQSLLYDTLLRLDAHNTLVGGLADDWTTDSATSYSFTIRDGATCSDGTEITAQVVADSLTKLADPATASSARALVFGPGDATITADDATSTVAIRLSRPFSELPTGMTFSQSGIVCPTGLADPKALATRPVDGAYSGAYTLVTAQPGVNYKLALRTDYDQWPEYTSKLEGVAPATINFGISTDNSTIANQLQSGDLDFAGIADDNVSRFESSQDYSVEQAVIGWTYVAFNQRKGSVFHDNIALRTAVAQALSRKGYVNAVSNGRSPVSASIADAQTQCAIDDDSLLVPEDKDAAAKALAGRSIDMIGANSLGVGGSGNTYVQEALTAAGADVTLKNTDTAGWATVITQQSKPWDLTLLGANAPLLTSLTRVFGTPAEEGGRNVTGADLPKADAALDQALSAIDQDAKCTAFAKVQEIILDDVAVVPLASVTNELVMRDGLTVGVFNGNVDYKTIRVAG